MRDGNGETYNVDYVRPGSWTKGISSWGGS
jgi:hypothetical protein